MNASAGATAWREASLAAAVFALDPTSTGIALRVGAGPVRNDWLTLLQSLLPVGAPFRRVPISIDDHALVGGLDLPATLAEGRPVKTKGVLGAAAGGVLLIGMAERVSSNLAARIATAMDRGEVHAANGGLAIATRFGVVALDEGFGWDERPPEALLDRLALHVDLSKVAYRDTDAIVHHPSEIAEARQRLPMIAINDEAAVALTITAAKLGVFSFRPPLLALRTARAICALRGGDSVDESDLAAAARLALASRAAFLPPDDTQSQDARGEKREAEPRDDGERKGPAVTEQTLAEVVVAACASAIPEGLLSHLSARDKERGKSGRGAEASPSKKLRGRPLAARRGELRDGRLSVIDTLRAAAPWQKLRRAPPTNGNARRIVVRPEDFRIVRFRPHRATATIFVVDASGSSAAHRLAEVKGAIELLLADCYMRRDSVALISFRGKSAKTILAPTRSLTRAKRVLADLPGGGGTPLALGLDAGITMAASLRRRGEAPLLVLMTDGRANIDSEGEAGRVRAFEDALNAGRRVSAAGFAALAIDTSPEIQKQVEPPTLQIGRAMNARYIELPTVEAARVTEAVRSAVAAA
jgi:magnesium chelatase subunit D